MAHVHVVSRTIRESRKILWPARLMYMYMQSSRTPGPVAVASYSDSSRSQTVPVGRDLGTRLYSGTYVLSI